MRGLTFMRRAALLAALCTSIAPGASRAAGTIPLAMSIQLDLTGAPAANCLLYLYVTGTVSTPTSVYSDFGLTTPSANPLQCDQSGRLPLFWLADGTVHPRLTDASGVVIVDVPTMQVLGPSSSSGGGGGTVDPNTIFGTGDIKFRPTSEVLDGWVRLNGTTIGSATSGATGRANSDTKNLFTYLWSNCTDAHCPVSGGRGGSGLADFNANKKLGVPDFRGRAPVGLDDMGGAAASRLAASNVTSGGGDGVTTPAATGGEANHALTSAELAAHTHVATSVVTDPGHAHSFSGAVIINAPGANGPAGGNQFATISATNSATTGVTVATTNASTGSGTAHNNMGPFVLGTWHVKL